MSSYQPNDPRFQQPGHLPVAQHGQGQYGQQYPGYPQSGQAGYGQYPQQQQYGYGSPSPTAGPLSPAPTTTGNPVVELQWIPGTQDSVFVDRWFKELDKEGRGIVGGLEIAMFLKRSNLPKDSLRTIWSLIDSKNLGYVNKSQFNNIIRLVSISCSPIYMGSPPSLERLQKTLYDKIALPAALLEEPAKAAPVVVAAPAPAPTAATPPAVHVVTTVSGYPAYSYPPQQPGAMYPAPPQPAYPGHAGAPVNVHAPAAVADDSEFSDFSSASHAPVPLSSGSGVGMMARAGSSRLDAVLDEFGPLSAASPTSTATAPTGPQWAPPAADKVLIDKWFAELDTDNKGVVGGLAIAMFLKKSNLPKDSLRTIWSLVDSKNAGHVNKDQFTNIIRLVSISCSPIYMGSAPTMERFEKTLNDSIRLPYALTEEAAAAEGAKPAATTDAGAVYATVPMQRTPSGVTAIPAAVMTVVAVPVPVREVNWVPPPIDAVYLDKWFAELDAENKGTLGGLAVAMFLKKSNLPTEALRAIWSLIDSASLGYVNKLQFTNMTRLAAIQCCPAYAAYPPSLERLEQTLHEFIPLPLALVHEQPPLALETAPAAVPAATDQLPVETLSMTAPSLPSPVHREMSDGSLTYSPAKSVSSATTDPLDTPVGPAQWVPSTQDAIYIDEWFAELDTEGKGTIGGLACAMFLKRSNLSKETLRTIWALVDSSHMGFVNKAQFTNMVRMVSIHSSPAYLSLPPSLVCLQQTLQEFIPLPPALLVNPAETTPSTEPSLPVGAAGSSGTAPAGTAPIVGSEPLLFAAPAPAPLAHSTPVPAALLWAPPGADKVLIDKWFAELDAENKGVVGGLAIAMFLKKSNLPKDSLRTIWSLVDSKNAGHVNKDQFTSIIRLVSISCSPIYMGSTPTMERFEKTLNDEIPLPFALTDPSLSAAPVVSVAPAMHAAPVPRAVSVDSGDDDDMGDFSPPVAVQGSEGGSHKSSLEAKTSFTLGQTGSVAGATTSAAPAHRLSVFDDLVENDLKAMDDDWEDFTEGAPTPSASAKETAVSQSMESAAPTEVPNAAAAPPMSASNAIDLMDLLGDDVPAPAPTPSGFAAEFTSPAANKSIDLFDFDVSAPAPALQPAAAVEEEDDFGDFGEAPQATTSTHTEFSPPTQLRESVSQSMSLEKPGPGGGATSAVDEFGDAEFADDDFGDFETHSPMPSMSQLESKASLFDMDPPAGGNTGAMSYSVSELSLFDTPGDQTDDFMQDAFAGNLSSKPSTHEVDLLDFLSEPAPAAVFPVSKPSAHTHNNNVATFAAFEDPFSAPAKSSLPVNQSVSLLDDEFGVPAPPAATTSSPPAPASRNTAALLNRKNLKSRELDALCATLMKKCLYEQAFNCNEQAKIVRSIESLTAQKSRAVEDDDLESAMILKKDINLLQLKVTGVDQEAVWEEEARSSRAGDSLQETAELLCAVDSVMGAKFKRIFLTSVPASNAALDIQLQFYIAAKRYARMVLAICSTHSMYPKQWLQVLQVAVAKVKEGNEIVAKFKRLSASDRNALTSHLKISEYALGLVAMSEIGMWVSASCTEAMVHEKIAGEVYAVCQDLLSEVDQLWGMGSRFKAMAMDTLTLEAARLAESKNVRYCNFTLRPLSYEVCKRDGDKMKVDTMKLYDNPVLIENSHYMEPLIKLWLHDVAKELPQCAAAVF